ncbi:MAG: TetR family transcriptional regulator [Coleofasciculaceae cyanobacterium RL_1_1]|nr:TetR family transcriptional regulator [Coleofasciculaceae cyanobacterium RL_1_1]
MVKASTQAKLLAIGERFFLEKGYNHTGIQEVLQEAGVPKGSFYYYFKSKEDFGLGVIEASNRSYLEQLEQCFSDETRSPLNQLRRYFENGIKTFIRNDYRCGCLVGILSQEMASQNEAFRLCLDRILNDWRDRFDRCLKNAQSIGELASHWDTWQLASFILDSWEGALQRAKVSRSSAPLERFVSVLFDAVLTTGVIAAPNLDPASIPSSSPR